MQIIKQLLCEIEEKKKIKILYACETGSRAWGFPSPDSDYDVRFLYVHERDWYLNLGIKKDTIEYMVDETWDITGWDFRKSLLLLKKSNVPLIERFQSPIVYLGNDNFIADFKSLIENYYSPVAVFYHHYSLAKKFWEDLKDKDEVKLKSYFYLIRSLLSCNWIINYNAVLPMHIEGLMVKIDEDIKDRLRELIQFKSTVGEKYLHPKEVYLNNWIIKIWELMEASKDKIKANNTDFALLNNFFLKTINTNVYN